MSEQSGQNRLVSVIVRTKDRPSLLQEALESLCVQTHRPLQAVVVNDGGADVSAVVEQFTDRIGVTYERLEPGRGRCAAANRGLELASGSWVAFLDDDDIWLPEGVATLLPGDPPGPVATYGRVEAFLCSPLGEEREHSPFQDFGRPFDENALLFENFIPIIGCLLPLEAVRAVGGFDESLECFEDWDLFLRLSPRLDFHFVDVRVAEYRVFGSSFITGAGGQELQHRGRTAIYQKHWDRLSPEVLSRMQHHAKAVVLPEAINHETASWRQRVTDLDRGVRDFENGVADLRRQVEDRDDRLESTWQERLVIDKERERLARECDVLAHERDDLIGQRDAGLAENLYLSKAISTEPTRNTLVSVVIVNYNGRHHLERCLPSLNETRAVPIEVIVVDNGSSDDSVVWMKEHHPEVRILKMGNNLGFGAANRHGADAARGSYVAFLNSDTVVEPTWLVELLRVLMVDPDVAAACSTLRLLEHPDVLNGFGGEMSKLGYGYDRHYGCPYDMLKTAVATRDVFFPTAAAMLMRKPDFWACGAFDAKMFMYHEDVDLGWRLYLLGRRVVVCRDSVVHHHFGGTSHKMQGLQWRERLGSRHNLRSMLKHYEVVNILKAVKGLLKLWWQMGAVRHTFHVFAWNAYHLPSTLSERRAIQKRRCVTDAELTRLGFISPAPYPAPNPEVPLSGPEPDGHDWVANPVLHVGRHCAIGRLGYGWYPPHPIEGDMVRPFCGRARCWLKVMPNATGSVEIDLHVPPDHTDNGPVRLRANGVETEHQPAAELWQSVRVDGVSADDRGLVEVIIEGPAWRPHLDTGNWDFRRLAGAVRSVRFAAEAPSEPPKYAGVSAVITTFNRWPILEMTLDALAAQDWPQLQVVVVDDGSSDDTWAKLQRYRDANGTRLNLTIATQENQGQGMARNHALSLAEEDLVLFLGDDIIPEPGLVRAHVEHHLRLGEPAAVVGFTDWYRSEMTVTPFMNMVNLEGHQFGYGFMESGKDQPFTCFYTSNISLDRTVLGDRPFDSKFDSYGWEDVELGYRLSKRGVRIVYDENARAGHFHPTDVPSFFRRQVQVGRTHHDLLAIHPELARNPYMPPILPPSWYRLARPFAKPMVSIFNAFDRRRLRLPKRVLHHLMMIGFYNGRDEKRP